MTEDELPPVDPLDAQTLTEFPPEPLSVHFAGFTFTVSVPQALAVAVAGVFADSAAGVIAEERKARAAAAADLRGGFGKVVADCVRPAIEGIGKAFQRITALEEVVFPKPNTEAAPKPADATLPDDHTAPENHVG